MRRLKRIRFDLVNSFLFGVFTVFFIFGFLLQPINPIELMAMNSINNYITMATMDDEFVKEIANNCSIFLNNDEDTGEVVKCVVNKVSPYYNYTLENRTSLIKMPSELKESGGVCRDVAIVYQNVFRLYGWKADLILEDNHVYNHVYTDDTSCIINGKDYVCYGEKIE